MIYLAMQSTAYLKSKLLTEAGFGAMEERRQFRVDMVLSSVILLTTSKIHI